MDEHARRVEAGKWLKAKRTEVGYATAVAFARALTIDPSMVSNYERGANSVDDDRASQIAKVLRLPEMEVRRRFGLWVPDDDRYRQPASVLEAIEADPNLDDEGRAHFRKQYHLLTRLSRYNREHGDPQLWEVPTGNGSTVETRVIAETQGLDDRDTESGQSADQED